MSNDAGDNAAAAWAKSRLDEAVHEIMKKLTTGRFRHVPVLDGGKLVGIISIGDVVKQIISEQEFTIRELEKYIKGSY